MHSIRNSVDRLAARLPGRSYVTLRFTVHQRLAPIVKPLIERLLPFDDDGETYRCSIIQWTLNERPVLHTHRGVVSTMRVDGPLQDAIDGVIQDWIVEHGLYDQPRQRREIDRLKADREAKAVIAAWVSDTTTTSHDDAGKCLSSFTADTPCAACREGSRHA